MPGHAQKVTGIPESAPIFRYRAGQPPENGLPRVRRATIHRLQQHWGDRMPRPAALDRHAVAANAAATRARAIAQGLLITGRARRSQPLPEGEFVRLERLSAIGFYWVKKDGTEIRSGGSFAQASPLQLGFLDMMAAAGGM
jgi:hypothetical protein